MKHRFYLTGHISRATEILNHVKLQLLSPWVSIFPKKLMEIEKVYLWVKVGLIFGALWLIREKQKGREQPARTICLDFREKVELRLSILETTQV